MTLPGDYVAMRRGKNGLRYTLIAADDAAVKAIDKIKEDELVVVRIRRNRSLPQMKLFFAILDHVAEATAYAHREVLLKWLKLQLHRYDWMMMPDGEVIRVPHSISFPAMPQGEFQRFFDQAMEVICTEVLPGYD